MSTLEYEIKYRLLKILVDDPSLTQRQMAEKMGVSLGKLNFCLAEFTKKGLVKVNRFKESKTKLKYAYVLTPAGIEEKARVTVRFLSRKMEEYEEIKRQIAEITRDVEENGSKEGAGLQD